MARTHKKPLRKVKKDAINTEIRKKLGVTQAQLAAILNVSRAYIGMAESGKRNLHSSSNTLLTNIYLQFHELETGKQPSYRSLETNLILNDAYKNALPEMKRLEKDCRYRLKNLKKMMDTMKENARDAENAIIVFTTAISRIEEISGQAQEKGSSRMIEGLNLLKQQAYERLLTCWEPEQAKLHGKIESIAGEARVLRRYRLKVMKEYMPKKIKRI